VPNLRTERALIVGIPAWALWVIAAAALAIGEVTPGLFFLAALAVAALAARPFLAGEAMEAGEQVEVAKLEGATALVLR